MEMCAQCEEDALLYPFMHSSSSWFVSRYQSIQEEEIPSPLRMNSSSTHHHYDDVVS